MGADNGDSILDGVIGKLQPPTLSGLHAVGKNVLTYSFTSLNILYKQGQNVLWLRKIVISGSNSYPMRTLWEHLIYTDASRLGWYDIIMM